jgi:ribA/ribD-fused uncharacterized protein
MFIMGQERDYIIHNAEFVKGFFGEYRWLSNFHECEIFFNGLRFPATENAYVYAKIAPELRTEFQETIDELMVCSAAESKKIGKSVPIRDDWDAIKYDIMSAVVFDKYYRHKELRKALLSTGYKHLEETNHWKDTFWGVCDGKGHNKLGQIHMSIRDYWAKEYPELLNKKKATKLF